MCGVVVDALHKFNENYSHLEFIMNRKVDIVNVSNLPKKNLVAGKRVDCDP